MFDWLSPRVVIAVNGVQMPHGFVAFSSIVDVSLVPGLLGGTLVIETKEGVCRTRVARALAVFEAILDALHALRGPSIYRTAIVPPAAARERSRLRRRHASVGPHDLMIGRTMTH